MAILAGIDEAGVGPLLGPMVVSSAAFSIPDGLLRNDLWQVLNRSISKTKKGTAGRIVIADSKKAYDRSQGLASLEKTVLVCLEIMGKSPENVGELLNLLCPDCLQRLGDYPWHQTIADNALGSYPMTKIAANVLSNDLEANSIKLLEIETACLDVAYFNRQIDTVKNKSSVLFSAVCRLIKAIWDKHSGDDQIQIIVDRQGGRMHYRRQLQLMFGELDFTILKEDPNDSSYELKTAGKSMRIHFVVGADEKYMPVSLASIVSKYVRELLVDDMNRYFISFSPELKPTAGYWTDGLRFVDDLKKMMPHVSYDSNQLIRCR